MIIGSVRQYTYIHKRGCIRWFLLFKMRLIFLYVFSLPVKVVQIFKHTNRISRKQIPTFNLDFQSQCKIIKFSFLLVRQWRCSWVAVDVTSHCSMAAGACISWRNNRKASEKQQPTFTLRTPDRCIQLNLESFYSLMWGVVSTLFTQQQAHRNTDARLRGTFESKSVVKSDIQHNTVNY